MSASSQDLPTVSDEKVDRLLAYMAPMPIDWIEYAAVMKATGLSEIEIDVAVGRANRLLGLTLANQGGPEYGGPKYLLRRKSEGEIYAFLQDGGFVGIARKERRNQWLFNWQMWSVLIAALAIIIPLSIDKCKVNKAQIHSVNAKQDTNNKQHKPIVD